jgi:hypothetical protein
MSAIERSTELQTDRRPSVSSLEESKVAEGTLKKKKKKKEGKKRHVRHGSDMVQTDRILCVEWPAWRDMI